MSEELSDKRESFLKAPIFGDDSLDSAKVKDFYLYWENFVCC